ncbi:hypothetical protein K431DRAFT_139583 [Polychaeton citri CBS 116435]|uniref:Uncharacterized protein n=1 Tax=Polychaeton citri CBS 116435 TaxID=1314669 RepID=A0A9P4Q1V3_9PEZI|nr:hypothetical protein K431DRAFT_139583 [Polychaeton citri CBS 116435]
MSRLLSVGGIWTCFARCSSSWISSATLDAPFLRHKPGAISVRISISCRTENRVPVLSQSDNSVESREWLCLTRHSGQVHRFARAGSAFEAKQFHLGQYIPCFPSSACTIPDLQGSVRCRGLRTLDAMFFTYSDID